MKRILAFSGSNSSTSINQRLVEAVSKLAANDFQVDLIQLDQFEHPIYSMDIEKDFGIPESVFQLKTVLSKYDGFIISTPEHNGSIPAFFKNTLDWLSRSGSKSIEGKNVLLLSTSEGKGGASKALEYAAKVIPYHGGKLIGKVPFPSFSENFKDGVILNHELRDEISELLKVL